jgi:hypothetical protein
MPFSLREVDHIILLKIGIMIYSETFYDGWVGEHVHLYGETGYENKEYVTVFTTKSEFIICHSQ